MYSINSYKVTFAGKPAHIHDIKTLLKTIYLSSFMSGLGKQQS